MPIKYGRGRLVHILLSEVVGGEAPPDLAERIIARAFPKRRMAVRWLAAAVAAAVVLIVVVLGWMLPGDSYPEPQVSGSYEIVGGGALRRGSVVKTREKSATLRLGGYCWVELEPRSVLRVGGGEREEEVFVEEGKVICDVERGKGEFVVRTEAGKVLVKGTMFSVQVLRKEDCLVKMHVKVLAGAVLLSAMFAWGADQVALQAGGEETVTKPKLPDGMKGFSGMLEGKVVSIEKHGFVLKVRKVLKLWEGNKAKKPKSAIGKKLLVNTQWEKGDSGKWRPVPNHMTFIKSLKVGEKIKIEVINDEGERLHILELSEKQRKRVQKAKEADKDKKSPDKKEKPKQPEKALGKIEHGKPAYKAKDHKAWKNKGRIVGRVRNAPTFEVEALNSKGRTVKSARVEAGSEAYELEWLKPGTYTLRVSAKGYKTLEVEGLKVKAKHDLFVDLEFTPAQEGEGRDERPEGWPKEGALLGEVVEIATKTISIKVAKTSKGAEKMVGHTVTFYVNWIKNKQGKWVPDPEEVKLIHSVEVGNRVEVKFYFEEHYRIAKLEKQ